MELIIDPKINEVLTDEECDKLVDESIILDKNEFKVDHIIEDDKENHFTYKKYEKDVDWDNADSVYDLVNDVMNNSHFEKKEKLYILGFVLTYNKNCYLKVIKDKAKKFRRGYSALQGTIEMQRNQMNIMKEKSKRLQNELVEKNRTIKTLKKENNWLKQNKYKIRNGTFDPNSMPKSLKDDYDNGELNFNKPNYDKVQPMTNSTPNLEPQQPKKKYVVVRKKTTQF